MGLPFTGIHSGSELARTSHFGAYSAGGYDSDIKIDSSGNKYIFHSNKNIVKYDSKDNIVWQKTLANFSYQDATIDSSGNLYLAGTAGNNPSGVGIVVKLDSSGTIVWQKQYALTQWINSGGNIHVDASGNVYCGFWYGPSNNDYADLAKYDSSGVLQWRVQLTYSTVYYNCRPGGIATDSAGNVYMGAHTYNSQASSASWESYAIKINSSGSVQWQRKIYHSSDDVFISDGTIVDSSGYIYFYGFKKYRTAFLLKMDTNGNTIWQKEITISAGDSLYPGNFDFDGTYFYGLIWGSRSGIESYNNAWIVIYDTSGNLVNQQKITIDGVSVYAYGFAVAGDFLYIDGYGPFHWDAKVSKTGKKQGTYPGIGHTFTYGTSNLALTNSNTSNVSGGMSISGIATTASNASVSISDIAGTYSIRKF